METKFEKTEIWVICAECGHKRRNHRVLFEKINRYGEHYETERKYHRFVQCMGCDSFKYAVSEMDLEDGDADRSPEEKNFIVYPDAPGFVHRHQAKLSNDDQLVPTMVWKMYRETIDALNGGIRTLAAGGLRAVVEAICLDKQIKAANLQLKIEELAKQNWLTVSQAALLHEERYLGNAALHELETPISEDIEDGLDIVEGLINAIYLLPSKAENLKKRREAKSKEHPSIKKAAVEKSKTPPKG